MSEQRSDEPSGYMCHGEAEAGSRSRASLREFMRTESGSAGLLVAAAVVALIWANSAWSDSYEELWLRPFSIAFGSGSISMDLHHWVNDGLMVVFFFVVGLEVRREFSIGELTERNRLIIPVVAGIGGMVVPALLYWVLNPSGEAARGWGAVIGTDTAFLLGMLALVGPAVSTQLRIFLLTLTVIDDIVAVTVIGVIYSDNLNLGPLFVALGCLVVLFVLDRLGVWRASPYVIVLVVLWLATVESGVHASIAGMLSGLLVPAMEPDKRIVEAAARHGRAFRQSPLPGLQRSARRALNRAVSVNERLQEVLHGWTSYVIVPVFALANAGVDLRDGVLERSLTSSVTWGIVLGLVVGKTIGIGAGAALADRLRWGALPEGVQSGHVLAGGALSGIGFTVSLLIVSLAFTDTDIQDEAVVGVLLAAVLASLAGWVLFKAAATFWGQRDAALPTRLAVPIDPDVDHVRGRPDAPLTLVEYFDFECPFCARATGSAEEVRSALGDRLRYVARHLPLDQHPNAVPAAIASEAAHRQGRFWEMHDLLFTRQDRLSDDDLIGAAAELGLDVDLFASDLADEDLLARVQRDADGAALSGVRGTPTFFIGGIRHEGPFDARTLIAALEADGRNRERR